jgi:tetratricopeptide (TPR) repeat protein
MSEENNVTSEADELPPASQKTKEQWLEEGKVLTFHAPTRYEEGLAAYEQAIRLAPNDGLAHRMKGYTLRALRRY